MRRIAEPEEIAEPAGWQARSPPLALNELRRPFRRSVHESAETEHQGAPRELREEFRGMSVEEREQAREVFRRLPPDRRARFQRAIQHWDELTPEQREKVRGHVQQLRRFSEERRQRIEKNRPAWENMDRVERDQMQRCLERFRSLSPARQEALVEERFPDRSPEQRARILDRLRAR